VRQYEQLEQDVRALHDADAGRLVVASIYSVGLHHMRALIDEFSAAHPRAEIHLEYLHPDRVCEEVANGDADLGIVSYAKQTDLLAAVPWRNEKLVLAVHPEHRLADLAHDAFATNGSPPSAPFTELNGEPFIAFECVLEIRSAIDRALAKHGATVEVALEFDKIETIKRAIEINAGVSILPEPSIRREIAMGTLAKVELVGDSLERPLGIVHRRDRQLSELGRRFVELLKKVAEQLDEQDAPQAFEPRQLQARA
jgi:DNA-binding transcriptional LysR family regulator